MNTAIQIEGLSYSYPDEKNGARQALSQVGFSVQQGEIFGLLGPNGGGKTTLFKILSTSLPRFSGRVSVFGLDLSKDPNGIRKKIGVVFQNPSLDKKLTLLENIVTQGALYGLPAADSRTRAGALLNKLSLSDRADDYVEKLSGGMQRRGEIAKGLLHKPELLLMDEPSTGLDPGARRELWHLLFDLKKDGVTIMVTTHLMEEGDKCDRLGIMHQGHLVAIGTPDDLKKKIGGDMVIVQSTSPAALAEKVKAIYSGKPVVLGETVRMEIAEGHKFIPKLVESMPGMVTAVSLGKPTLEDVFIHETGQEFR